MLMDDEGWAMQMAAMNQGTKLSIFSEARITKMGNTSTEEQQHSKYLWNMSEEELAREV